MTAGEDVQAVARQLVADERRRLGLPDNRAGRRAAEKVVQRRIAAHRAQQGKGGAPSRRRPARRAARGARP